MPNKTYVIDGVEYALAPVEPTPEMLAAAVPFPEHLRLRHPDDATWEARMQAATAGDQMAAVQTYRKMLAAAPTPATVATEAVAQGGGVEWWRTAERVLAAWDSTVLPASHDGMMQERMEELRALLASPAGQVGGGLISAGVVINNNQPGSQYIVEAPHGQTVCVGTEVFIK